MATATLSATRPAPAGTAGIAGDREVDESTATAVVAAPLERIDIGEWWLGDRDRLGSSARFAAGFTVAPDGKRIAVDVELVGGRLLVHYCVERLALKDRLVLESVSDLAMPAGRTTIRILWEVSLAPIDEASSALTSRVRTSVAAEFAKFLSRQGIPLDAFLSQRLPASVARNERLTRVFAAGIERAARGH